MVYRKYSLQSRAWEVPFKHRHKSIDLQLLAKIEAFHVTTFCHVKHFSMQQNIMTPFFDIQKNEEINKKCTIKEPATQQHIKNAQLVTKKNLRNQYFHNWLETQNRSSTNSRQEFTQKEVKNNYQFEDYLTSITKPAHRISLTRLRLGCHALPVQTGKYENRGALILVEERTCLICKENCTENKHFLMYCRGYTTLRRELHSHISNADTRYTNLSDNEKTKYLLTAENKVTSKIIGKYFHLMFQKEKRFLILNEFSNYLYTDMVNINLYFY